MFMSKEGFYFGENDKNLSFGELEKEGRDVIETSIAEGDKRIVSKTLREGDGDKIVIETIGPAFIDEEEDGKKEVSGDVLVYFFEGEEVTSFLYTLTYKKEAN